MYLSKFQLFNYKSFLDSGLLDLTPVINSSLAKVNQQHQIHLRLSAVPNLKSVFLQDV
jgi:hypothetical protein